MARLAASTLFLTVLVLSAGVISVAAQEGPAWSWQRQQAEVLPQGDLRWAPNAFQFEAGASVRYIDFENGNDANAGTREAPWKHHPGDPAATGRARDGGGADTYVFKRGVTYRGVITKLGPGTPDAPVALTSSPDWGTGEARIYGSEPVGNWTKGADHADIPEPDNVWYADLDFAPRCLWMVEGDDVTRIALARTPNWEVSNPDDVKSEWFLWENPQWWTNPAWDLPDGKKAHKCFDTKNLTEDADYYLGAYVWTEWGIVMGTPFATEVKAFDPETRTMAVEGPWYGQSERIIRNNRYYLEDKPHYLDAPGEFWFDKKGRGGRLYLRLPGDRDPNTVALEAANRVSMIDLADASNVTVSGLAFRFTNVFWDLGAREFINRDVDAACVRMLGSGENISVTNCTFQHVNKAVRIHADADTDRIVGVTVADNLIENTDHGAIAVSDSSRWAKSDPPFSKLDDVNVMRNKLYRIGLRPIRGNHGHAVTVNFADTAEIAGNILDRCYGAGLFIFGGKGSGQTRDKPLARILIHHNKVTDPLLNTNDWGGIETWQGGPTYVYNNISGNPGGYWNWAFSPQKPGSARFGHAYYLDGAFKNYHFNNIAWGKSSDPASPLGNSSAFQEIHSYQNTFFNNTVHNFVKGSRRQSPHAGRNKYLANIWQDIGEWLFFHTQPAATEAEGNAAHAGEQKDHFALETNAYSRNVFHDVSSKFAAFEPSGAWRTDLQAFAEALSEGGPLAGDVGIMAPRPPLRDAAGHDFRPTPGSPAIDNGVKVFVPWGLYEMVGEWNFYPTGKDPSMVIDEHWYMAPHLRNRTEYHDQPMFPLEGVNIGRSDYIEGPLENWTTGALQFNGRDQYLVMKNVEMPEARAPEMREVTEADWLTGSVPVRMTVDHEIEFTLGLKGEPEGHTLAVDLNWLKKDGFGGGLGMVGRQKIAGDGPYTFKVKPGDENGLDKYLLNVYVTPDGTWANKTKSVALRVDRVAAPPSFDPQIADSSFIIEAYLRTNRGGSVISKLEDGVGKAGYEVAIVRDGNIRLVLKHPGGEVSLYKTGRLADGAWHHLLVEVDRQARMATAYVDGKKVWDEGIPTDPDVSFANAADMFVGRGREGYFEGAIDFLRISRGTLKDARTSIEELYEWQFNGPQLRDFTGRAPTGARRDAGAIELAP